jgi:plastocyanin
MPSRPGRIVALLLLVGLIGAGCSSKKTTTQPTTPAVTTPAVTTPTETSESSETTGTITIGSDTANDKGMQTVSGDEIKVEVNSFYFEPTVLQGTAGAQVTIELDNASTTLHNFTLEDQGIDQDIQAGEDQTVTVTFPSTGFLEFFCKYHRASGMVGELIV